MLRAPSKQAEECYRRAAKCAVRSNDASDIETRQDWIEIERHWTMLARIHEFSEQVSDYQDIMKQQCRPLL